MAKSIVTQSASNESFAELLLGPILNDMACGGGIDTQWAQGRLQSKPMKASRRAVLRSAHVFALPKEEIKRIERGDYIISLEEYIADDFRSLADESFNAGFDFCLAFVKAVRDGDAAALEELLQPQAEEADPA